MSNTAVRMVETEKYGTCVTFKEYGHKDQSLYHMVSFNGKKIVVTNPVAKRKRTSTFVNVNGVFFKS